MLTVDINIKEIERLKHDKNHVFRYKTNDGSAEIILRRLLLSLDPEATSVHIDYVEFK